MTKQRQITSSRLGRLSQLGRLAGGLVGGAISEGARQFAQGRRPSLGDIMLTPANAQRMAGKLSEMRGAAMKVGQLLSMDSGQLVSPEFSDILSRLREGAHHMPLGQVAEVLEKAWGEGWEIQFKRFIFTPLAAASIGQVHEAVLKDGRRIAIKVQYPGISESIDSDVDNVAVMLRMFNLLPKEIEIDTLLAEAKKQLHVEADYRQEADALNRFRQFLGDDDRFTLPEVLDEMTTTEVLTMSYLDGLPIESLTERGDEERNRIAGHMLELGMREIFDWGLVQTDPNFANYRYQPKSGRIELMDFGATRQYSHEQRSAMRALLNACIDGDDTDMLRAATEVGYIGDSDSSGYRDSVMVLLRTATEPARLASDYDFGCSDLAGRMSEVVMDMRLRKRFGQIPPADILFLHRKVGGLYLLLSRLNVKLPVHQYVRGNLTSGMQ